MAGTCPALVTGSAPDSFIFLINTLIASHYIFDTNSQYPPNYDLKPMEIFDYIVVGSGSAGATAASRLAENPNLRILLIEAGGIPTPNTEIPGMMLQNIRSSLNWYDQMEPSKICKASKNGRCMYSRGKVLGGSSTLNGMVYVRGNSGDYEEWEKTGNNNWDWDTVTKYFKKSQGLEQETLKSNPIYGIDGPLTTTYPEGDEYLKSFILEAAKELNQTISTDPVFKGYYESLYTIRNGRRCSTAKAFLSNDKVRNNLFIARDVFVEKVRIRKRSLTAKGVVVRKNGSNFNVFVKKEVILSAGVISSPMILQKSGIGPSDFISNPIIDLPVGKNFQDHIALMYFFIKIQDEVLSNRPSADFLDVTFQYYSKQKGPLASPGSMNLIGFINTLNESAVYPNIQFHHVLLRKGDLGIKSFLELFDASPKYSENLLKHSETSDILLILPFLIKPKSRGEVKFRPNSDKPFISPNYLDHEDDVNALIGAVNYIQKLINTKVMRDRKAELVTFNHPCKIGEETDWKCVFKHFAFTAIHGVGTCKMAKKEFGGVVDDKLRVYGVKNLRVADASIMPTITSGNTHIPTVMIGERLADFILQDNIT